MRRILLLLVFSVLSTTALQAQTPLIEAIKAKELPQVQRLVEEGMDVNAMDANGATPLMWAAYQGDLEMVKWLVDNGADPFLKKGVIYLNEEKTAYYGNLTGIAAGEGKLDMLHYLIEEVGIDLDDKEFNPEIGQEDGILTAYKATLLDLRGTELEVLSACETGLGVARNGEGVYGLQEAFQVAGAETVIFSILNVADEQTQEVMGLFYQNWLQNKMSKRHAFKTAQQTLNEKYEETYFWRVLVMVGGE
jgi:hypothetical protein